MRGLRFKLLRILGIHTHTHIYIYIYIGIYELWDLLVQASRLHGLWALGSSILFEFDFNPKRLMAVTGARLKTETNSNPEAQNGPKAWYSMVFGPKSLIFWVLPPPVTVYIRCPIKCGI